MAVVKADGYGHGAVHVGQTALDSGARWLGVYAVSEGVALRTNGVTAPVLVFGPFSRREAQHVIRYGLTPTIGSLEAACALQEAAEKEAVRYHLKLDTGLSRAGVNYAAALELIHNVSQQCPALTLDGLYTHFASADEADKSVTRKQLELFESTIRQIASAGFGYRYVHAANSAALLEVPEARFNLVRAGIASYGYYPSDSTARDVPLQPALQLVSEVTRVHTITAGTGVGYGHEFRAARESVIALVPIGYGDGLPRTLGGGAGRVVLHGHAAPIVGRVSMDQITVDVTDISHVRPGDTVIVIGQQNDARQDAEDLGRQAGTISYDILTGLLPRVPRLYIRRGVLQREGLGGSSTAPDRGPGHSATA